MTIFAEVSGLREWLLSVTAATGRVSWSHDKIIGRPHTHTGGLLPLRAFCKQKCCNGWSQPGRSRSCCTSSTRPVTMETGCYTEAAERAERDGTANRSSSTVHCVVPIHVKSADTLWHHVIRYWKCCCVKCDKTDFAHILKKAAWVQVFISHDFLKGKTLSKSSSKADF